MFLARKPDGMAIAVYELTTEASYRGKTTKIEYDKRLFDGWRWSPKKMVSTEERKGAKSPTKWVPNGTSGGWSAVARTSELAQFKVALLAKGH